MSQRLPNLGFLLSLCTVVMLAGCADRADQPVTGVSLNPAETPLASLGDAPRVEIRSPDDGEVVSGTVLIEGRTRERGNDLLRTDLHIASDQWDDSELVMSTTQEGWSYEWATDDLFGGDYLITAVAHDVEGWSTSSSISLTVLGPERPSPPALVYIALDRDTVTAGESTIGTVVLSGPAIEGGAEVGLSSNNPSITIIEPTLVPIPEGDSIGTFTVTGAPVSQDSWAAITGTSGTGQQDYQTVGLWVLPAGVTIDSLTLDPTLVRGGETSEATIRLNGPAPEGGAVVELASNNTDRATVPPSVTVPAGETTASFTVTSLPITEPASVLISGTYGGVTRSAWLTVDRAPAGEGQLASLTIDPEIVVGGHDSQGTVTLGAAVDGDTEVALSSTDETVATVPPSVTVPAGQTSATFTITTLPNTTGQGQFSWISGEAGGVERGASITTTAEPSGPSIASVEIIPSPLGGGGLATGFVTFDASLDDGVQVSLSSSHPDLVQVPSQASWIWSPGVRAFAVTTSPVASNTPVTITATACCGGLGEGTATVSVTTDPPPPADVIGIQRARFRNGVLEVRATSTSETALLTVFIKGSQTGDDIAIAGMRHVGGGRYEVERPWLNAPAPEDLEVRSNLGGSDTSRVR